MSLPFFTQPKKSTISNSFRNKKSYTKIVRFFKICKNYFLNTIYFLFIESVPLALAKKVCQFKRPPNLETFKHCKNANSAKHDLFKM